MPQPPQPPSTGRAQDLTDAEFAELDDLLAATPEPLEPLDAVMLDGYLCGVLVQPVLLEPATWLAHVFDFDARPLPDDTDAAWLARTTALTMRRHGALNRALEEDGWFDPLVLEPDEETPTSATNAPTAPGEGSNDDNPGADLSRRSEAPAKLCSEVGSPQAYPAQLSQALRSGLSPISQALMPWAAGFQHACLCFPDLAEMPDDAVMSALARLYRHLPAETDEEREVVATLDREQPLATLDDAMTDLVATVADLHDLTHEQRYKVDTVRRDAPKVGRNDPCPCGSGKKYKQCHGAN